MAVASASADGSEKSVGTRIRFRREGPWPESSHVGAWYKVELGPPLDGPPGVWQEGAMPLQTIAARIRGFSVLNAHPAGCAANVDAELEVATRGAPGSGLGAALVVGASTGYGLSSLASASSATVRVRSPCASSGAQGDKTASAGWYNLAAMSRQAQARGRDVAVVNGDAFSDAVKEPRPWRRVRATGTSSNCSCTAWRLPSGPIRARGSLDTPR